MRAREAKLGMSVTIEDNDRVIRWHGIVKGKPIQHSITNECRFFYIPIVMSTDGFTYPIKSTRVQPFRNNNIER